MKTEVTALKTAPALAGPLTSHRNQDPEALANIKSRLAVLEEVDSESYFMCFDCSVSSVLSVYFRLSVSLSQFMYTFMYTYL